MHWLSAVTRSLLFCLPLGLTQCAEKPNAAELAQRGLAPAASASAADAVPAGVRGWELGREYPYRLELGSAVAFGDQADFLDFDLSGELLVIPTSVAKNQTTLFVAVRNAKVVSRAPDPQDQLQKLAKQVSATGCLLTLVGGRVSEMRIAPDLSPMTLGTYREIGSRLQFIDSRDGAAKYEVDEYDNTGKYAAEYTRDDATGLHFRKRKLRYSALLQQAQAQAQAQAPTQAAGPWADGPGKIVPNITVSESEVSLLPDGRPVQIKARDELLIAGSQNPVRSKNTLSLVAGVAVAGQAHDFASMAVHMIRVGADEVFGGKIPVSSVDPARIRGLKYDDVIKRLLELNAKNPEVLGGPAAAEPGARAKSQEVMQEVSSLFMALAAIFRQQPETIAKARRSLKNSPVLASTILDALGSSGSSDAHVVLGELARSRAVEEKLRRRALTALMRTPNPTPASIAALQGLLTDDPFNSSALYGLGTYARRLREAGDLEQPSKLAALLRERLAKAGDVQARIEVVLGAIMNCGCEELLPQVVPLLSHYTESVRAKAVRALQSMRDPKVDALIAERMKRDVSSEVKIAAIETARIREPVEPVLSTLTELTAKDADPRVRYKGVELLIQWLPKREDLRASLQRVAAKDPQVEVRSRAQAAL